MPIHHLPIKHPVCIVYEAGKRYEWQLGKDGWCYAEDIWSQTRGSSISGKFKPAKNDNPQKDPYANCRWTLGGCNE